MQRIFYIQDASAVTLLRTLLGRTCNCHTAWMFRV